MLESVLADVLTRVLGQYLEGIDREHVRFGAWSGLVELHTVALRPEALAVLFETLGIALPVSVESGFIGLLRLVVPWKSIGSSPVQIYLQDVTLVAQPVRGDGSDDSQLELRERRIKRAKLDTDDAVREASWDVSLQREQKTTASWSSWLVSDQLKGTILENIQVHLTNIIIRFEDPFSNPKSPYVASIYCSSIKIVSANENWKEAFVERASSITRKLLEIKGFHVDWEPIVQKTCTGSPFEDRESSSQRFHSIDHLRHYVNSSSTSRTMSSEGPSAPRSLIRHIDGFMRLRLYTDPVQTNVDFQLQEPNVDLDICFPEVFVELNDVQYSCLIQTSLYFARIATRGFRPSSPKARWKWAVDQLLPGCTDRFQRSCRFTPSGLARTRQHRDSYITLRTAFLKARRTGIAEPETIKQDLEQFESQTPFDEVIAYRDAVDHVVEQYAQEWVSAKDLKMQEEHTSGTSRRSFWSMLGYSGSVEGSNNGKNDSSPGASIDLGQPVDNPKPSGSEAKPIETRPCSTLALRAAFLLQKASLRMCERGYPSIPKPRIELKLQDFQIGVMYSSTEDLIIESVLGSVEAWDLCNESKMVYSRLSPLGHDEISEPRSTEIHAIYPQNVSQAIEEIRSGSNPAKDLLVLNDEGIGSECGNEDSRESIFDDLKEPLHETDDSSTRLDFQSRATRCTRDNSPRATYRVTETEFLGNRLNSAKQRFISALRYSQLSTDNDSGVHSAVLDVSVATLEAIVDGPKGSFLWGLKFWQPKGLAEDPIMAFLGAAAGARIAELRIEFQEALLADSVPLTINAVILAPRFVVPSPSENGPAIVINMGTLGVCTSDNSPHVDGLSASEEPKHLRYSNYVLTLDDLGVYFSPDLKTAVSKDLTLNEGNLLFGNRDFGVDDMDISTVVGVERIIRPFSLHFVLQALRDSKVAQVAHSTALEDGGNDGMAKVRVRGSIPELSLILTQQAFQHILVALRVWGDGLKMHTINGDIPTIVPNAQARPWENAGNDGVIPASTKEVLDGVSALTSAISPPREIEVVSSTRRHLRSTLAAYSVKIVLQTVSVELRENADQKLLTTTMSDLRAVIVKKSRAGLDANLSLRSWSVIDGSRGSTAAFRRLLYSGTFVSAEGVSPPRSGQSNVDKSTPWDENFVNIHYHLDFSSNEQQVSFRFLSLHMNCVRETYLRIVQYFDKVRRYVSQRRRSQRRRIDHPKGDGVNVTRDEKWALNTSQTDAAAVPQRSQCGKLIVSSKFDGFSCQLVASGGVISIFEMKESTVQFFREINGLKKARGVFGSFFIRDLTAPLREHVTILSYEHIDQSIYAAEYAISGNPPCENARNDEWVLNFPNESEPFYNLSISFDHIHFLFLNRFTELIQDYFLALVTRARPALVSIVTETASEFEDAERLMSAETYKSIYTRFLVSIDLRDLSFRIPRHSASLSESLTFNITHVHIDNFKDDRFDFWSARFNGVQGAVQYLLRDNSNKGLESSVSSTFMTDCIADLKIEPVLGEKADENGEEVTKTINVRFPAPLHINLSEAQYTILFFVLTENIAETISNDNLAGVLESFPQNMDDSANPEDDSSDANPSSLNPMLEKGSVMNASSAKSPISTSILQLSLPSLNVEISRGWDVAQNSCKVLGLCLTKVCAEIRVSTPRHIVLEFRCNLFSVSDLRPEGQVANKNLIVRLLPSRAQCTTEFGDVSGVMDGTENAENAFLSYDKKGTDKPTIVVSLNQLQLDVIPELIRDLSYLAVPGWPFLETSTFPSDYIIVGRTLTLVLSESQVVLSSEVSHTGRPALVLTGEFEVKIDWMRATGAKTISVLSKNFEVSAVPKAPSLVEYSEDGHGFEGFYALPFEKSHSPLLYPTDSSFDLIGPDVDEGGRRIQFSIDAVLCVLCTSEIPLLRTIFQRLGSLKPSYLSRRKWVVPSSNGNSQNANQKELHKKIALDKLSLSIQVPVSRFLITDDSAGRFVPIIEVRLTSLLMNAHASSMVQIEGQLAMDLFNSSKGCWEPAIEPWTIIVSMSNGQSGSRSYVIKSNERLNINVAPNIITSALAIAHTLQEKSRAPIDRSVECERNVQKISKIEPSSGDSYTKRPSVAAFLVRNELGIHIHTSVPGERGWKTVGNFEEVEVDAQSEALVSSRSDEIQGSREHVLKCLISVPGYQTLDLSASEPGKFNYTLHSVSEPSSGQGSLYVETSSIDVLWEVVLRKGVPLCTLRSPYRIINATRSKLDVAVLPKSLENPDITFDHIHPSTTLAPNEVYSIPTHACCGVLYIRPVISPCGNSSTDLKKANRPFQWSPPLPKFSWLFTIAQEKQFSERHATSHSRRSFENYPLVGCKPLHGDHAFFFKVIPDTAASGISTKPSWLDVSIKAPIVLMNRLPAPLSYRIYESTKSDILPAYVKNDGGGSVLAAGVVPGLDDAHLHVSGEEMSNKFLSLAFDNDPGETSDISSRNIPSDFGIPVCLNDLCLGRVKNIFTQRPGPPETRGQTRKVFRPVSRSSNDGTNKLSFFAGMWVRNRSDTSVDICSRPSYYSPGSVPVHLRECLPLNAPDKYICCEGPFLSIRLSQNSLSDAEEFVTQSDWWTTPCVADEITKPISIGLPGKSLELEVRPSKGLGCPTYIVTIRNSSWIINSTSSHLQWCHQSSLDAQGNCPTRLLQTLSPNQIKGLHRDSKSSSYAVRLRLAENNGQSEWIWSSAIPLDIGFSREFPAKMYRPRTHDQYIARVASKALAGSSRALIIFGEDRQNPPYRIVNLCRNRALAFSQMGSKERPWLVRAGKTTRYSWDYPLARPDQRRLSVRVLEKEDLEGPAPRNDGQGQRSRSPRAPVSNLNIDEVGDRVMVLSDQYDPPVVFSVSVNGATKVLTLFDEDLVTADVEKQIDKEDSQESSKPDESVPIVAMDEIRSDQLDNFGSDLHYDTIVPDYPTADSSESETVEPNNHYEGSVDAAIFLHSIGFSVMDATPEEFIYMSMSGLLLNFECINKEQYLAVSIENLQIDNQLSKTTYPVLLWQPPNREKLSGNSQGESRVSNALAIELLREKSSDDIFMLRNFRACIRPCNIALEDGLVTSVLKFIEDSSLGEAARKHEELHGQDDEGRTFCALTASVQGADSVRQKRSTSSSKRIYVHDFKIDATTVRLTSQGSGSAIAKAAGLSSSARAIVGLLLNVENCDFNFPDISIQNVFDSLHHFGILIRDYYLTELDRQRFKLLTSNSLVGNPAAFFDAVGTGARDLLTEPGKAKGSADFLQSVGRGSKSLFTHTVGGIADSVSRFPRAVSTGIERAVGDSDYLQERHRIRGSNLAGGYRGSTAKNPAHGLATGALSLMHGISSGVTGFVREPMEGAKQGGAGGLLKGIGKAFIGGVAKPVAGAMDLVAEPAAGLYWQMTDLSGSYFIASERPPRAFRRSSDRIERYDLRYSVGVWLLRAVAFNSGATIHGKLIDWVELSDRIGRREKGAEVWAWSIIQRFSRSMPGMKKQTRAELKEHAWGHDSDDRLESRPEKTRAALLTKGELIIASLDCKLITIIPIWKDATYDIVGSNKELIVRATIVHQQVGGNLKETNSNLLHEAQSLIQAPWDATSEKKRKPAVGESSTDRIACGSLEAREDLEQMLMNSVVTQKGDTRGCESETFQSEVSRSSGPSGSGLEMSVASHWHEANEVEMRGRGHDDKPAWEMQTTVSLPNAETGNVGYAAEEKEDLQMLVHRLSSQQLEEGPSTSQNEGLRIVLANRVGDDTELRLKNGGLEQGMWKTEAPVQISSWEANIMEIVACQTDAVKELELSGWMEYSIIEGPGARIVGSLELDFSKMQNGPSSLTAKVSNGFMTEITTSGTGSGTSVVNFRRLTVEQKSSDLESRTLPNNSHAVANITEKDKGRSIGPSNDRLSGEEQLLQQLMDIGFKFEDAVAALANANGDIVKAVDLLMKEK